MTANTIKDERRTNEIALDYSKIGRFFDHLFSGHVLFCARALYRCKSGAKRRQTSLNACKAYKSFLLIENSVPTKPSPACSTYENLAMQGLPWGTFIKRFSTQISDDDYPIHFASALLAKNEIDVIVTTDLALISMSEIFTKFGDTERGATYISALIYWRNKLYSGNG